jgi:DNA-binding protein HU-beta/integration host factor subunit beta
MSNVTKKDICEAIAGTTGLTRVDTQIIVETFLDTIHNTLQSGNNIELRGFGRFKIKPKKARKARNPITGAAVQVPEGFKLVFQASKELRKRINDKNKDAIATPAAGA